MQRTMADLPSCFDATIEAITRAVERNQSILLVGPPGVGKTMLATRIGSLLPPMTADEATRVNWTYIAARLRFPDNGPITERPFRAPHHTVSVACLTGARLRMCRYDREPPCHKRCSCGLCRYVPGEFLLATYGVLFLDEIVEFTGLALATVRDVRRTGQVAGYPAPFLLVGSTTRCPCGWYGSAARPCTCSPRAILAWTQRLDRIRDLFGGEIVVPSVTLTQLREERSR